MSPYLVSLIACASLPGMAGNASAAIITVTSTADAGPGTLRAAIAAAHGQAGADEINFDAALSGHAIVLTSGEIMIGSQPVKVNAEALAGGITVSGNGVSRLFNVPADGSLELRSLTMRAGHTGGSGGAILAAGTLTLTGCTFEGCSADEAGGAIRSSAACLVEHCTFSGNTADLGGALSGSGTTTLTHCTLSGNSGNVSGGGLWNASALTLTNTIVSGNSAPAGADIFNTGTVTRAGGNLVQSLQNSGGSDSGPAAIATAPQLLPLANYGGPTPTMPPRATSPALDRVPAGSFVADQRGLPRMMWGAVDIGAVEAGTQTDCAWEVREFFYPQSRPDSLQSLGDALALVSDPSAVITESAPAVINHRDPHHPGSSGYFESDQPVLVDNRTPDRVGGDDNNFATVARAFITIVEEDDYTFGFSSSDGARLRIFGATFISSTRLNASNPANPAHSGDTLSFPGLTDNSATLGVCHLTPGVYPVEFLTWEQQGLAYYEVFAARGAHTSVDAAFRLAGDVSPGGPFTTGSLTVKQLPPVWMQEFEDDTGGFTVTNVNGPFDGPWAHDGENGSWGTAGQGSEVAAAPSTKLTSSPVTMHCRGDALLQFTHRFSFEEGNWDGGQVMLSVNEGPFVLVPPAAFTLNGYTGNVSPTSIADIRGEPAFVFDSPGYVVPVYITTIARLGTFNAGDTLRVQFLASFDRDTSRGTPAWEIDTVSIEQQCAGADPGWELTTIRNGADTMETALTQMFSHWGGDLQPNAVRSFAATVNLFDPQAGGGGHGQTQTPYPGDGAADDDQFALGARATLNVPATDDYTFCILADDAARLRIPGSRGWNVISEGAAATLLDGFQTGSAADVFGQVRLAAGAHQIELIAHEGLGAAFTCLWGARGRHREFDPEIFTLVGGPGMIRPSAPFELARQQGLSRPLNDDFAAALKASPRTLACVAGATREPGEPGAGSGTLWWRLSAQPGTLVLDTAGSDFDTVLNVYTGTGLTELTPLASADNYDGSTAARVTIALIAPIELHVQAGGVNSAGLLALSIGYIAPPGNDAFVTPRALGSAYSISVAGDNDAATAEAGEPAHAAGVAAGSSVWFTWTAPVSGEFIVDTRGSRYDTLLAVYTGTSLVGLNRVASNDDVSSVEKQSSVSISAAAGAGFWIAVDGRDTTARGAWRLNVAHRPHVISTTLLRGPAEDSPRTFRMVWQSEPWTTYRIEQSSNLSVWTAIVGGFPSDGSSTGIDITGISGNVLSQYFRVRRE